MSQEHDKKGSQRAGHLQGQVGHPRPGLVARSNWPKPGEPARRALVMGLGISGAAVSRLLVRLGFEVVVSERRKAADFGPEAAELDSLGVNIVDEERAYNILQARYGGPDLVVPSPGVPHDHVLLSLARESKIEVAGELEVAFRHQPLPVLAVTGSNGKTTVASLAGHILRAAGVPCFVGGNIGNPLSNLALDFQNDALGDRRFAVVEASSFQLETISRFKAKAAALLNLTPDHLDRHKDMDGYLAAKKRVFNLQGRNDVAVVNLDDPAVAGLGAPANVFGFSRARRPGLGAWVSGGRIEVADGGLVLASKSWSDFSLVGGHNMDNVMAAAGLAWAAGVDPGAALEHAAGFRPSDHRLQLVGVFGGISFVDDSKGTNVGAVASALESFDRPVVLIAGGRDKDLDFAYLIPHVEKKVRRLVLMGECREKMRRALAGSAPVTMAVDMRQAVAAALREARAGDVVLLSPACASFDQFSDYRQRGETFALEAVVQAKALGLESDGPDGGRADESGDGHKNGNGNGNGKKNGDGNNGNKGPGDDGTPPVAGPEGAC
ncbi:MAG: UDP-N-acetylmuramoyl-L-alanine--D-glutamate ligase [Deltaproteobacteria bacterium]|nr:UDP-N-acetylmuramoyl-L-alanine--D-glutamate ligase [Deltaproteobacteria bacterium]